MGQGGDPGGASIIESGLKAAVCAVFSSGSDEPTAYQEHPDGKEGVWP
jgi:hypothetical protein